ncbi:MAG: glycosyltransferase [Bacteroidales bacterium]|nr:glycosyltransferase [Bacteroidales bacterium]
MVTIITINRNNAFGLERTMHSIFTQTRTDFEYIVIDGASSDGSIGVIKKYTDSLAGRLKWISEPDNGIYNAMNKGIRMASGKYVQFLNSGDCLASDDVTERMLEELKKNDYPSILYGNMLKDMPDGKVIRDRCFAGKDISFLGFYTGTLNHSPAYIRKDLFEKYGLYDESLRIVSDWKWYLQAIVLGEEKPVYTDIDVTLFDMHGISETNKELDKVERKKVLGELIPQTILSDYDNWAFPINQMKRLKRHPWAYKLVWFLERCLFKIEKCHNKRKHESIY